MKTINSTVAAELAKDVYQPVIFIKVVIPEGNTQRFSDWSANLTMSGSTYYPRGMKVGSIRQGQSSIVDSISISIDDVTREFFGALTGIRGENLNKISFELFLGVLNSSQSLIGTQSLFTGTVDSWTYKPGNIELSVVSIFNQWARKTSSMFSSSCRWQEFKGPYCRYSGGGSSCDRSYAKCKNYSNTRNFGGFRWLSYLSGKTLRIGAKSDKPLAL